MALLGVRVDTLIPAFRRVLHYARVIRNAAVGSSLGFRTAQLLLPRLFRREREAPINPFFADAAHADIISRAVSPQKGGMK